MNAPPPPADYQAPVSTVLVPVGHWEQILKAVPADSSLRAELDRLGAEAEEFESLGDEGIAYQVLQVLAKSDGNVTTHMSQHTLAVMYGEMVRNLLATFKITRKDQIDG